MHVAIDEVSTSGITNRHHSEGCDEEESDDAQWTVVEKLHPKTEISGNTEDAPAELLENELTSKALSIVEKSAMSEAQLYAYEKFWMGITDEKGFLEARYNKGRAEGKEEANRENACKMKALNMPDEMISPA